jgi:methylated-DNA-[protein]-cysteine S-methyltransferase
MKAETASYFACIASPLGEVGIVWSGGRCPRIRRLLLPHAGVKTAARIGRECPGAAQAEVQAGIAVLVKGLLTGRETDTAAVVLDFEGVSPFARRVMAACRKIPRGFVGTYGGLAATAGVPDGARAVGNVMAKNPLPLFVPCHRVIRSDRSLGGFGGGLAMKRALLEAEGVLFDTQGRVDARSIR